MVCKTVKQSIRFLIMTVHVFTIFLSGAARPRVYIYFAAFYSRPIAK